MRSHESFSPGRIAISRQATTPILRSGPMLQRADCPCCAEGLSITNIRETDNNPQRIGHEFDVNVDLQYPASGTAGELHSRMVGKIRSTRGVRPRSKHMDRNVCFLHPSPQIFRSQPLTRGKTVMRYALAAHE